MVWVALGIKTDSSHMREVVIFLILRQCGRRPEEGRVYDAPSDRLYQSVVTDEVGPIPLINQMGSNSDLMDRVKMAICSTYDVAP